MTTRRANDFRRSAPREIKILYHFPAALCDVLVHAQKADIGKAGGTPVCALVFGKTGVYERATTLRLRFSGRSMARAAAWTSAAVTAAIPATCSAGETSLPNESIVEP